MQKFRYFYTFIIPAITLLFFCSCKDNNKSSQNAVGKKQIISNPAGASIIYNKKVIGKTPYTISAKPNFYVIKLEKPGFNPQYASFQIKEGNNPAATYELKKTTASVLVDSVPSQAYVTFNDIRIGETPCVLPDLEFGTYKLTLNKAGHSSKDVSFTINSERPLKISTSLEKNIGSIEITSDPANAKIMLNGQNVGITPFKGEFPDGEYKIVLQLPNYIEMTSTVVIQKGKKIHKKYKLDIMPCSFEIVTVPEKAKIFFDGKYVGDSPVLIEDQLANKEHHLIINAPGFAPQNHKVKTTPGKKETFSYNLKRNCGDLDLQINPPGVTVYIDGEKYAVTKKSESSKQSQIISVKNLSPGAHTVRIAHRRGIPNSKTKKINIIAGETVRPEPMSLWIPTAEVVYTDDSTEHVIILSENEKGIFVEPQNHIKYTILRKKIKKINYFKDSE